MGRTREMRRLRTCQLVLALASVLIPAPANPFALPRTALRRAGRARDEVVVNAKARKRLKKARHLPESGDPTDFLHRGSASKRIANGAADAYSGAPNLDELTAGGLGGDLGEQGYSSLQEFTGLLEHGMTMRSQSHFRSLEECPALVLNGDFQPLSFVPLSIWSWREAIKAAFMDRVVVVATYDRYIRSASYTIQLPSVIALKDYVNQHGKKPTFTRRNIFLRDAFCCQYCGAHFSSNLLTFDHVVPRSKGGGTNWDNVVSACRACNNRKRDVPVNKLDKLGMKLLREPKAPSYYELQNQARSFPPKVMHETWKDYLGVWTEHSTTSTLPIVNNTVAPV